MGAFTSLLLLVCQLPGQSAPLTDVQAMLDALPPGSYVSIPSGSYGRVVIHQPLTIVGADPAPTFAEIALDGATGGRLSLANLRTTSNLEGKGFDELRLFEIEVAAGRVRVNGLDYLELAHLTFTPIPFGDVEAPGASVMLLDSAVGSLSGARLYRSGSTCVQVAPTDFEKTLDNDLILAQPVRVGGNLSLSWSLPGPVAVLLGRTRTQVPLHAPHSAAGYWHLAGSRWLTVTVVTPGSLSIQVPPAMELTGLQIAFQVMGPNRYLSRPATAVVR